MRFWRGVGVVTRLELSQRVRGVAWYVLLAIFVVLVLVVTVLLTVVVGAYADSGGWLYSIIIYFVLLLGTLVAPALSGNAINGERDAGTLATMQVTTITTGQIVLGKFLAAWVSALAFLVAAVPFLAIAVLTGGLNPLTIVTSVLVLAVELWVVAALGVGFSGILPRSLFSIVVTYLAVAALSLGTLIAFGLGGFVSQSESRTTYIEAAYSSDGTLDYPIICNAPVVNTGRTPRFDFYWPILAANPYVVLADAAPGDFSATGAPENLFSTLSFAVRQAQVAPELDKTYDYCAQVKAGTDLLGDQPTPKQVYERTLPSWFVGLGIHILLAAGALVWARARTRTPAGRLPSGSRVA